MKNNPSKLWLADSVKNPVVLSTSNSVSKHKRHSPQGGRVDTESLQLSDNVIFTIADDAYFNKASVLIDSVHKFAPDCNMVKVSVDEHHIGTHGKAIELGLHDINLPQKAIDHWATLDKYGHGNSIVSMPLEKRTAAQYKTYIDEELEFTTELCTAIKPSMFAWCFSKGAKRVLYIDPDCELYGNIDYLFEQLIDNECILFPHLLNADTIDEGFSPGKEWEKTQDFSC